MQLNYPNIYKIARQTAGLTQERWAEVLGVSPESVRLYETGRGLPSDNIVALMSEVAPLPWLCYRHLRAKSAVANDILPEVECLDLPRAVLQLLSAIHDFKPRCDELLKIAADGVVTADESDLFCRIVDELNGIIRAALTVKYAEGGTSYERRAGHEQS